MSKTRKYCGTLNNYSSAELAAITTYCMSNCPRYIIGEEVGKEGTPHLQMYIEFKNAVRLSTLKGINNRAHWEAAKGTTWDNYVYCSKENNYVLSPDDPEEWRSHPGKRTDIDNVRDILKDGGGMKEITEVATSYQSIQIAQAFLRYHEPKRNWKPNVKWFYGVPGSGKTRTAYEEARALAGDDDIYSHTNTGKWWDGYDQHEYVILDDLRNYPFSELLKILDRYECRVETKGGTRQFVARYIWITTPNKPEDFYYNEDIRQLTRRIDEVRKFELPEN